jgi:phosphotriesterase-related protein
MPPKPIQTVTGPIGYDELGKTLMHEHIFVAFPGAEFDPRYRLDRDAFIGRAVVRLKNLAEFGVKTLVDPCPIELGRDVRLLREVSEKSGVQIICATGFYYEAAGIPSYWRHMPVEEIAELYIREIEHGIDGTDIRAGIIKCATGAPTITPLEQRVLTAATIAQRATGVPILTHTEDGHCGPEQQDIFEGGGVALQHCLIGHSCGNHDPAYHRGLAARGSYVGFDRIGLVRRGSDDLRADNVVKLTEAGHGNRVMLSQDAYCGWRGKFIFETDPERTAKIDALRETDAWPRPHTGLFTDFVPKLKERGMSDAQIQQFLVDNPREYFKAAHALKQGA